MDFSTRYSTGFIVESTSLSNAIFSFESCWLSVFWPPSSVHADGSFHHEEFTAMLTEYDITLRPFPPRRHHRNAIEPKHRTIRSIFLRLKHHNQNFPDSLAAMRAIRISNDKEFISI